LNKHIKTNRMSRVTKTSKTYPGIRVSSDATDIAAKPYLGYRRGRGMPSAHEPVESLSDKARKTMDNICGCGEDDKIGNIKDEIEKCTKWTCEYYSYKKTSQCVMYNNAKECKVHEQRTKKSRRKKAR